MGVIKEIVDKVVPKAQKRIEKEGMGIREALLIEFKELGYIPEKESWNNYEFKNRSKGYGCSKSWKI